MSIGLLFWILMILWLVYGWAYNSNPGILGSMGWAGGTLLLFILLFLLGWHDFGFVIHQ
jgi:uncharacterized MAPEG superfamily protein